MMLLCVIGNNFTDETGNATRSVASFYTFDSARRDVIVSSLYKTLLDVTKKNESGGRK